MERGREMEKREEKRNNRAIEIGRVVAAWLAGESRYAV